MGATLFAWLAVAATPSAGHASDPDPWFGRDKALHYSLSAAIADGGYVVAVPLTERRGWRMLAGAAAGLAAGAGKEALDATGAGDPSWRDFTWDVLGTATGIGLATLIDWLLSRRSPPPLRGR